MNANIALLKLQACLSFVLFLAAITPAIAQLEPEQKKEPLPAISLAELAAASDVVALVQMRDGDYRYQREYPVSGSAHLKVLVPYKVDQPLEFIEVYEHGLHENECYFPDPTVFEEGRRYLVFLKRDPEDEVRYRGLPQGCAIDVLVTKEFGYALRIPVTGIDLADPVLNFAVETSYSDPYAREPEDVLESHLRDQWLAAGWLRRDGSDLIYTMGVALDEVRALMGPAGVSLDWHQKRFEQEP